MLGVTLHPEKGLTVVVSRRWVNRNNLRISFHSPIQGTDTCCLVVEGIKVDESLRRRGICKSFLQKIIVDNDFDLIIVEGVGNPTLASALLRWGWTYDHQVMDFYWWVDKNVSPNK